MTSDERYDVVVVGGGAAGLGGALALARARRSVLVVDAGTPRNAPAGHVHNVLGREGTPPAELVAIGRREVEGYGGTVVDGWVSALSRGEGDFRVDLADGRSVRARRLLVATGLTDELPDVPGVAELWGRSVLHCPYCHGWEVRDRAIGVLGSGPQSTVQALLWRQWSEDVVLFPHTGSLPTPEQQEQLAAQGVRVIEGAVAALDITDGALSGVRLTSGQVIAREALVVAPRFTTNAGLLGGLGIQPVDQVVHGAVRGTRIPADPTGLTEVPGVWVAGNVADVTAQVMASAAQGMAAATAINVDLVFADAQAAVQLGRSRQKAS
ncbi:NAD(P)/FAD-dependent oxidoreductase [Blastococcus haudaquaticus]|uniref:Thioredoxin reductase (NADPH) n=1 Tax=Blastococcus haudaquaticus TaxID=1938745 RepID=A0A286GPZ9_9ACTN|nr:NAD(P)/FAD-dependent oxidoreductase [Blastococcus haudaquaticus]SOD97603.1 thioredoxin reductase (NADPH) [Blastococcus haudaquaticus]